MASLALCATAVAEKATRPRNTTPTKVIGSKPRTSTVTVTVRGRNENGAKIGLRYVVRDRTYNDVLQSIDDLLNANANEAEA